MKFTNGRGGSLRAGVGIFAASCAALISSPALAQESEAQVEDIIVTAQRRAESIQDVPISITAATAEQLEESGTSSLTELGTIASGVNISDGNAYVFPTIRGIGSFIQGASTNSSVAVYVDGAFVPRMTSTALELDNVASVEILRGPQATLYGRNATGGAINVITRETHPGDPFSGNVQLTYGDYNQRRATFYLESGLGPMFAINASGYWVERDGYVENLASFNQDAEGEDLDSLGEYAGAVRLTFAPNTRTDISLALRTSEYDDTASGGGRQLNPAVAGPTLAFLNDGPGCGVAYAPGSNVCFGTSPFAFATEPYTTYGHANRRRGFDHSATLTAEYEADDFTFTSISAYTDSDIHTSTDLLSAEVPTLGFDGVQPSHNFSQELRVRSTFDGSFNFLAGVNYFDDHAEQTLISLIGNFPIVGEVADSSNTATALFGEAYFDLSERLSLTLGARYTEEEVEATALQSQLVPVGTTASVEDEAVTYRVVLDYDTDWGLLYGSVSTGYKSGGINATNLTGDPFDPEEITAYEIGFKSDLFNRRLRLNGSAFVYDFTGIQGQLVGGPTGGAQYFVNGDSAELSGLELSFDSQISEAFSLWGGVTYLIDREYTEFDIPANAITMTPALNASGNKLVGAPELSVVLGARYEYSLGDNGDLAFNVNLSHNSGYFLTLENNLGTGGLNSADAVTLVNARIEYTLTNGVSLALWGRNLTEEEYIRAGLSALGGATVLGSDGQPQEIGVTLGYRF